MKTKYGNLPDESLVVYMEGLIGKVWKILPLKEEQSLTVERYIEGLLRELIGNQDLVYELSNNKDFLSILGTLNELINVEEKEIYRSDIFKTISLIERMKVSLVGESK